MEAPFEEHFDYAGLIEENSTWPVSKLDPMDSLLVRSLFGLLYLVIFVLGMFGNVLVCYVVGRNRAMQTVTNLFISNLALSDLLLCALCVPFTPLYTFFGRWVFGKALCHTVAIAQGTSVYISTLTLTAIAVDRFYVIVHPFRPRMRPATCFGIVCGVWTVSLILTLPYGIYMNHRSLEGIYLCEENWPSEFVRQVFGGLTFCMQFVIPFCIISFCYTKISMKLHDQAKVKPGSKNSRREEADRERKRRTNRMLVAMVAVFGVSWLPLNVINLANDMYIPVSTWEYFNFCFFFVHALAMSSTCYNPFLYAWLNENFRKEFKRVLPCCDAEQALTSAVSIGGPSAQTLLQTSNSLLPDVVTNDSDQGAPTPSAAYCVMEDEVRFSGVPGQREEVAASI